MRQKGKVTGLWCLMPLLTIFQLYRSDGNVTKTKDILLQYSNYRFVDQFTGEAFIKDKKPNHVVWSYLFSVKLAIFISSNCQIQNLWLNIRPGQM